MSGLTWYVIDRTSNRIINAVTGPATAEDALRGFVAPEHLEARLEDDVPRHVLEAYRFWSERP